MHSERSVKLSSRTHFQRVSGHRSTCRRMFYQADRFWLDKQAAAAAQCEAVTHYTSTAGTQHKQNVQWYNIGYTERQI